MAMEVVVMQVAVQAMQLARARTLANDLDRSAAPVDTELRASARVRASGDRRIHPRTADARMNTPGHCAVRHAHECQKSTHTDESMDCTMTVRRFGAPAEGAMASSPTTMSPPGRTASAAARRLISMRRARSTWHLDQLQAASLVERLPLPCLRPRTVRLH